MESSGSVIKGKYFNKIHKFLPLFSFNGWCILLFLHGFFSVQIFQSKEFEVNVETFVMLKLDSSIIYKSYLIHNYIIV